MHRDSHLSDDWSYRDSLRHIANERPYQRHLSPPELFPSARLVEKAEGAENQETLQSTETEKP